MVTRVANNSSQKIYVQISRWGKGNDGGDSSVFAIAPNYYDTWTQRTQAGGFIMCFTRGDYGPGVFVEKYLLVPSSDIIVFNDKVMENGRTIYQINRSLSKIGHEGLWQTTISDDNNNQNEITFGKGSEMVAECLIK